MSKHITTSTKRLTLDALIRSTPAMKKIPFIVIAEPSIVAMTGFKLTSIYHNLVELAISNLEKNPASEKGADNIKNVLDFCKKTNDGQFILESAVKSLNIINSIDYTGDKQYIASVAARALISMASEISPEYKNDVLGPLNEFLVQNYPEVRENIITLLSSCTTKELSRNEVESAFQLVTLAREEVSLMLACADHCAVTDYATQRLYLIESMEEKNRLVQFEATMAGKIISGAQILDSEHESMEMLKSNFRFYNSEEFMQEVWARDFLKTMKDEPGSEKAKQMLLRLRNDSIGDEISEKRVRYALALLSSAMEQTSTIGARKILVTLVGIIDQVQICDFYEKMNKELIKPLGDYDAIMEARSKMKPKIQQTAKAFTHHIRFPEYANALIELKSDKGEIQAKALGYLAFEVVTDDLHFVEQAMKYYQEKMGHDISQVFDYEKDGRYRFFFFKRHDPDDSKTYSEFFSKAINRSGVQDIYSSFVAGFKNHPFTTLAELKGAIGRLSQMEKTIQEEKFIKRLATKPETELAREMVENLLNKTKFGKSEEEIFSALSLLSNAMKGTNDYGKKMLALAISDLYYGAPKEIQESLFSVIEPILGENISDPKAFLIDIYDPADAEIFDLLFPFLKNYLGEDGEGKLELMKLKKKCSLALANYSNDPADPEATLHLADILDILRVPRMQEEKEHINAIASIIEALKNVKTKKYKQMAAVKAAPALAELVCSLSSDHKKDAMNFAGTWLKANSKETKMQMIYLLTKTQLSTDQEYAAVLLGLARPNSDELEIIESKSKSPYVKQQCLGRIEEEQNESSKPRKFPISSGELIKTANGVLTKEKTESDHENMDLFLESMGGLITSLGEGSMPDIEQLLDYGAQLQTDSRENRYNNEYAKEAFKFHLAFMHLDSDKREEAVNMYRQRLDPVQVNEFEGEDTKPGVPMPRENAQKVHQISVGARKSLASMNAFISKLANPNIQEQLSEIADSFALLNPDELNILIHTFDGMLSQFSSVPEEHRTVAQANIAKCTLAIMDCISDELYIEVSPRIKEKIAFSPQIRNMLLTNLFESEYGEENGLSIAIAFTIIGPSMEEMAKLIDSANSQEVRKYAYSEYNEAWKLYFVGLFRDNPESIQAQNILDSLIKTTLEYPEQKVEFTAFVISQALEETNEIGEEKLMAALARTYKEIADSDLRTRFKDSILESSRSKADVILPVLEFVDAQQKRLQQIGTPAKILTALEKDGIEAAVQTHLAKSNKAKESPAQIAQAPTDDGKLYNQLALSINGFRATPASKEGLEYLKVVASVLPKIGNNEQFISTIIPAMLEPIALLADEGRRHDAEKNLVLGIIYLLKNSDEQCRKIYINRFSRAMDNLPSLRAKIQQALLASRCTADSSNMPVVYLMDIIKPSHGELEILAKSAKSEFIRQSAYSKLQGSISKQPENKPAEKTAKVKLNGDELKIINHSLEYLQIENIENGVEEFVKLDPAARDFAIARFIASQFSAEHWKLRAHAYEKMVESIYSKLNLQKSSAKARYECLLGNPGLLSTSQRQTISLIVKKEQDEEITSQDIKDSINWVKKMGQSGLRELIYQTSPFTRMARILSTSRKFYGELPIHNPNDQIMLTQIIGYDPAQSDINHLINGVREKSPENARYFQEFKTYGITYSIESIRQFVSYAKATFDLFEFLGQDVKTVKKIIENRESTLFSPSSKNRMADAGFSYKVSYDDRSNMDIDAVFDGVSGQMKGEFASSRAKEIFELGIFSGMIDDIKNAAVFCELADLSIAMDNLDSGLRDLRMGAGSTIALTIRNGNQLRAIHAGDSRWRIYRSGRIVEDSADHSLFRDICQDAITKIKQGDDQNAQVSLSLLVTESDSLHIIDFIKANHPTVSELADHVYWKYQPIPSNNLGSCLGGSLARLDISDPIILAKGDVVALCTDGISNTVCPHSIASAIRLPDLNHAVELIVEISNNRLCDTSDRDSCGCLKRGGDDDKYIILRRYEEEFPRNGRRSTMPLGIVGEGPMK